ncbi:hypothetical protein O6H91_14G009200 [Diphasiastrum complanatum]|uniref:Uncharacterized protein n=3 Tax=Diphasiastrum complanatum TaxID=34168 RepID=A0ACC2BLD6_DIPCM|nr:hypothetical protein O6H91_14G009200 [Diphasiastrum complanatum]KAJ7530586.1 hypothetical protein O6H91_14G009200 [Diphasiastrum complanatum]KAJ7530588.1 hypothetical protein O6H91_14G009200 [Diphasiastrum complanatum]
MAPMTHSNMLSNDEFSFYRPRLESGSSFIYKFPESHAQPASTATSTPTSLAFLEVENSGEELFNQEQSSPYKIWQMSKTCPKAHFYPRSEAVNNRLDVREQLCFNSRAQDSPVDFSPQEVHNNASENESKDQLEHSTLNPSLACNQSNGDQSMTDRATMGELIARLRGNLTGQGSTFTAPSGTIPAHSSETVMSSFTFNRIDLPTSNSLQQYTTDSSLAEPTFRLPLLTDKDFPFLNQRPSLREEGRHGAETNQFIRSDFNDKIEKISCCPSQNQNYNPSSNPGLLTKRLANAEVIKVLFEDDGGRTVLDLGISHSRVINHHPSFITGSSHDSTMGATEVAISNQAAVPNFLDTVEFGQAQKVLSNPEQQAKLYTFQATLNGFDGYHLKKQKIHHEDVSEKSWKPICFESNKNAGPIQEPSDKRFNGLEGTIAEVTSMAERSSSGNSESLSSRLNTRDIPKPQEPLKQDYIHVRARRGQATDSHSLAERVRREKISERMKFLQDLVPGCSKVTGKAMMLDEIINYVQSLQRQVEFLSMKLAALNPRLDMDLDYLLDRQTAQSSRQYTTDLAVILEEANHNSRFDQMPQLQSQVGSLGINLSDSNLRGVCTSVGSAAVYSDSFIEVQRHSSFQ